MDTPSSASAKRPSALFLSPEPPYPMIGGGPLRSASLLEYLSRHFAVHAIVFHQHGDPDPARALPPGIVEKLDLIQLPRHSKKILARGTRNALRLVRNRPPLLDRFAGFESAISRLISGREYDAAVLEHFWCAPYVHQIRRCTKRTILDLHNIESAWHRSLAGTESGSRAFALRRFARASEILERKWLPAFDYLLAASAHDASALRAVVPGAHIVVYPNALPEIPPPSRTEQHEIVFSGNLEYAPNIAAVRFFHHRIWTALRSRWPDLVWKIVGKNPEGIRRIVEGDPRIHVTGYVEDAIASLACAQVAVVPVLAGSGTRIKILEAWAAATPVVSTTLGVEGLDSTDGMNILLADDPGSFTECISGLLSSPERRAEIGGAGRKFFEERFTWPTAWRTLDSIFRNDVPGVSV